MGESFIIALISEMGQMKACVADNDGRGLLSGILSKVQSARRKIDKSREEV